MEENPYTAPIGGPESQSEKGELAGPSLRGMSEEERLGQGLVALAIALILCGDGFLVAYRILRLGMALSGSSLVRYSLTVILLYAVWRGHDWARWLAVALLGVAFAICALALFRHMHPLVVVVAFQMALCFGLLAFPSSVTAFLNFQRTRQHGR